VRTVQPRAINLHYGSNFISIKDLLAVRLAGRSRCVVTVHHAVPWHVTGERKRRLTGLASHLAHAVIVSTELMRGVLLRAGVPGSKVHVVPFGVQAPASPISRVEARAKLGLSADGFIVASLARLVPHKGIRDLIAAVSQPALRERGLLLVIAGDGPERPQLQAEAAGLGDAARFLGRIPDPSVLFSAADLFVLPSYEEGFGLVYIEAAFHGVPSVGTSVGGVPDTIQDGMTGLLVRPGDVGALATAIGRLRDDPELRLTFGEAARTRAHREFTEKRMAARYAQLLGIGGGAGSDVRGQV
jgi:glycosyltransferase involved in cell wall biosynthesis